MLLVLTEKIVDGYFASIPRAKPTLSQIHNTLLIAHRGAHDKKLGIRENTLPAFQLAKELGCFGIELDVHATLDGVLVVNHDKTLQRLWNHKAVIANLTFKELRQLEPGIATLAEVVSKYGSDLHLFIELKAPFHAEEALLHTLKELTPCKDYHLLTLEAEVFKQLTLFPKESLLLVAVHNNVSQFCHLSIKEGYGGVLGNYLLLTDKHRAQLERAGQNSGIGFVNSKNSLYRELHRGIQWVFTDRAVTVSRYLKDLVKKTVST